MSSEPLDDEYKKRRAKAYRDYDIICKQFPVLLEKMDALDPPKKKKKRRSAKKKKTEAEKKPDDPPALTPEIIARYKELAVIIKGFLKELGDDVDREAAAGGSTSQAAPPPPQPPPPPPGAGDNQ